jgi:prophage tail gpP-like protein
VNDQILVASVDSDHAFDRFSALELTNSLVQPSEASFEVGDVASYNALQSLIRLGVQMRVLVNSRPRLTGRIEFNDQAGDAQKGSELRFVVRTKLTDAFVAACDPRIAVKGLSLKQFVLACYATVGVTEEQFIFDPATARNLITGKPSGGGAAPADLDTIQLEQAKIRPPETVFAAVDRHLRRFGLMHWDAPDGKIIVGTPDDTQDPVHSFIERYTGDTMQNNVLSARRVQDVGQAPTLMGVYGQAGGREFTRAKISALEANETLVDAGFNRPVVMMDEQLKSQAIADRRVRREMAQRSRGLDGIEVTTDGLSHLIGSGSDRANFSPETVFACDIERLGGRIGAWVAETVKMREGASVGHTTSLTLVRRGVWVL